MQKAAGSRQGQDEALGFRLGEEFWICDFGFWIYGITGFDFFSLHTIYYIRHTSLKTATFLQLRRGDGLWVMSDELMIKIKFISSWILTAFSAIVPIETGARMGTASMGLLFRLGYSLPLNKFSPTSEISYPFLPDLRPTTYDFPRPRASRPSRSYSLPRCSDLSSSGWFLAFSRSVLASWCTISFSSSRALRPSSQPPVSSKQTLY